MFLLNLQGKEPIYEQIQTQIIRFIQVGALKPGDKLPSVRELAKENGINPNTVAKAYSQLEKRGLVHNIPKKGAYVGDIKADDQDKDHEIIQLLQMLKANGVSKNDIIAALEIIYEEDKSC